MTFMIWGVSTCHAVREAGKRTVLGDPILK
jgi:hypothetical protein